MQFISTWKNSQNPINNSQIEPTRTWHFVFPFFDNLLHFDVLYVKIRKKSLLLCCFKVSYMHFQSKKKKKSLIKSLLNKILFHFIQYNKKWIICVYYNNAPLVQQQGNYNSNLIWFQSPIWSNTFLQCCFCLRRALQKSP